MPKARMRKTSSKASLQNDFSEPTKNSKTDAKEKSELRKRKWCMWYVVSTITKIMVTSSFVFHIIIPIVVFTNPWIHSKMVFLNILRWPPFIDITKPEEFGIRGARNFYLDVDQNITIGVWHILPQSLLSSNIKEDQYEGLLQSGKPIFLYLHGNSGTRAGWHRVQLNKLIASMDYHVISIDYRGYGDSKGVPTEDGVVADSYHVYKWIKERQGHSPVFVWGHSLGTGITTKLAKKLCELDEKPNGVILESPFNNIRDAARGHPLSLPFRFLPYFQWVFVDTIKLNNIYFNSDENIGSVTTPLLIMHAKDDDIVPYDLGEKLYNAALKTRPVDSGPVEFISFNASYSYGHKHIFKAPELPSIVRRFVSTSLGEAV